MLRNRIVWLLAGICVVLLACQIVTSGAGIRREPETEPPVVNQGTHPAISTEIWHPAPGLTWQWQLSDLPVDSSIDADIYDIDVFEAQSELVTRLHAGGRKVICYISVGSWEDWRPDAARFPKQVIGKAYEGWEGERWLDIRQIDALKAVLLPRFDLCKDKGFDAVEPDNIDGYTNATGFNLTYQDQLRFNRWLAEEAHARGLAIGLKNDPDQTEDLLPYFDFAITEDCFAEAWCEQALVFIQAGKAVLAAEYTDTGVRLAEICDRSRQWGFSLIMKLRDLDAFRKTCE